MKMKFMASPTNQLNLVIISSNRTLNLNLATSKYFTSYDDTILLKKYELQQ